MNDAHGRRGLMLILSSPSGAGKSTLSRELLARDPGITLSVSGTTRPPRPGEVDGRDYFFLTPATFETMAVEGKFLEHAQVFGNRYGTPREPVDEALKAGGDVLFDVDWQGARQLKENAGDDVVSIFILPPSTAELEKRLQTRAQDTDNVVRQRMSVAMDEISHWIEYEYVLINEEVEESVAKVQAVLAAERHKRQPGTTPDEVLTEAEGLKRENQPQLKVFIDALGAQSRTGAKS